MNGHVDCAKVLIQNGTNVNAVDIWKQSALHVAARNGHVDVDVVSVLLRNGASINAVDKDNDTPLHIAAERGYVHSTLLLLCFGTAIDDKALEYDMTALLRPIKDRLKSLRDMKNTTLMSDEERHFMIHVAWFLDRKCPEATFKAYCAIRSFITFHGIFMGVGYGGFGDASVWNKKMNK